MKQESRIEILDRLAYKHSRNNSAINVDTFEDFVNAFTAEAVIILVRLAMAEYLIQSIKDNHENS